MNNMVLCWPSLQLTSYFLKFNLNAIPQILFRLHLDSILYLIVVWFTRMASGCWVFRSLSSIFGFRIFLLEINKKNSGKSVGAPSIVGVFSWKFPVAFPSEIFPQTVLVVQKTSKHTFREKTKMIQMYPTLCRHIHLVL